MQAMYEQHESPRWHIPGRGNCSALHTLPTELLVEIFKHLGWEDVLVMRQTCKFFFDISTSRPLWVCLFHRLSGELHAPPALEYPISAYTAMELEYVVMRRISSEIRWMIGAPPRVREYPTPDWHLEREDEAVLVTGGRWLLTCTRRNYGRVYAYDLDAPPSREPQCIIDLAINGRTEPGWLLGAETIGNTTSGWACNFFLIPKSTILPPDSPTDLPLDENHIYRLTVEGRGIEATLEAHKIKSVRNDIQALTEDIAFHGNYLVRRLETHWPLYHFEVCNWFLSDSAVHFKSYIEGDPDSETLDDFLVIPGDKLIIISRAYISLYNILHLQRIPAGKANETVLLQPYWKLAHTSVYREFSYPCLDSQTVRVAVIVDCLIYGLTVPHDNGISPQFRQISDIDFSDTPVTCLGMGKLYAYDPKNKGGIRMINFVWHSDEDGTRDVSSLLPPVTEPSEYRHFLLYQWKHNPLFEERSHRILSFAQGLWVVVDFAYK